MAHVRPCPKAPVETASHNELRRTSSAVVYAVVRRAAATVVALVVPWLFVLAAPLVGEAQHAGKAYRIGWLQATPRTTPPLQRIEEAFLQGLRDHGFVEGQNVSIERRYSDGRQGQYAALATEFVHLPVDVMIMGNSAAVRAATQATSTIPTVMLGVGNPERQGLVASLARPGGNVTGMSTQFGGDLSSKMFELLKETLPQLSKVAIVWNPDNLGSAISFSEGEVPAAKALGVTLVSFEVRGPSALWVHLVAVPFRARLLEFAVQHRLPTVAQASLWPQVGGLMSYGPNLDDVYRRAATHVAKILRDARPADLPVEQPVKFELAINLQTVSVGRYGVSYGPTCAIVGAQYGERWSTNGKGGAI